MKLPVCVLVLGMCAAGSVAFPSLKSRSKRSLIDVLLQAPPVVQAACRVKDIGSGEVIVDKVCQCQQETVGCDVGPIAVGAIEMTFCNKMSNQTLDDLLVLKYACNTTDPACGQGTVCDIGPIVYNNEKYYLCTDQTTALPPDSNANICKPGRNVTNLPPHTEPTTPSRPSSEKPTTPSQPDQRPSTVTTKLPDTKTPQRLPTTKSHWMPPAWTLPSMWPPIKPRPIPTLPPLPTLPPIRPTLPSWWPTWRWDQWRSWCRRWDWGHGGHDGWQHWGHGFGGWFNAGPRSTGGGVWFPGRFQRRRYGSSSIDED